jgi:hypothetical protein
MAVVGKYEEKLPCGGTLRVSKNTWEVGYYFPGPDQRHNGIFVTLDGTSILRYIEAFNENWAEYESLKKVIPAGGEFTKIGKMGMSIRISGYHPGVCLKSYHMPVQTQSQLQRITDGYLYAIQRTQQVQEFLAVL